MTENIEKNRACHFCKLDIAGTNTREHVIPQWLLDHLNIRNDLATPTHQTLAGVVRSHRKHPLGNLVLGGVCANCNNGWLSALESQTKPILIDAMNGLDPNGLDGASKFILARWAVKTAACLNYASNFHEFVPANIFHHLASQPDTLPSRVMVSSYTGDFDIPCYWIQSNSWVMSGSRDMESRKTKRLHKSAFKIALQFGAVAFIVAMWPHEDWDYQIYEGGSSVLGSGDRSTFSPDSPPLELHEKSTGGTLMSLLLGVGVSDK